MNEDVKKQVKQVISEQCKERSNKDVEWSDKTRMDQNLVNLVKALNDMEKLELEKQQKEDEMAFEQSKFEYSKYTDDRRMELDEIRVGTEQDRIDREMDMRKYESDAADKRALLENDAALQKIESEKKSNIFKTIIYGLGILAGVALHLGDVSAEKELGYDVDDRVSSFDKLKNDLKFFSK